LLKDLFASTRAEAIFLKFSDETFSVGIIR
jgi:hypothetical protein